MNSAASVTLGWLCWKTPFLALTDEISCRTGRLAFGGEGVGQIGLSSLMCQLSPPHERSNLTFWFDRHLPENCEIWILEFFNTIGSQRTLDGSQQHATNGRICAGSKTYGFEPFKKKHAVLSAHLQQANCWQGANLRGFANCSSRRCFEVLRALES